MAQVNKFKSVKILKSILMNCKKTKHLLLDYMDKIPDQDVMDEINSHLTHCESCASLYSFVSETMSSVNAFSESHPETSAYFSSRTMEKIRNSETRVFSPWAWIYNVLFKKVSIITASFAGLIAGVVLEIGRASCRERV